MKQLEKPKFFTTPIVGTMSIVFGIIVAFSFSKKLSDTHLTIIIISLILILFLWNLIKYIVNWHKFYKNYIQFYKKFEELESRYNTRVDEINNKELLISEYEKFIEIINYFIAGALIQNSEKETEQLKNLQNAICSWIRHFNEMKGDNNGRNI